MLHKLTIRRISFVRFASRFVPDLEATNLLEYFLISAVVSLLSIRFFLNLTGFPQIGGEGFHIAHMLWGGLLMLVSIIFFASFLNAQSKVIAAIFGGIGFGTFIDELGKFITSDNNYFYQPTIGIIYVFFVLLFLLIRWLASISVYSPETYIINAIEGLKEVVLNDLDTNEKHRTLAYLAKIKQPTPAITQLETLIKQTKPIRKQNPAVTKFINKLYAWYTTTISRKIISRILTTFFILSACINMASAVLLLVFYHEYTFTTLGTLCASLLVLIQALIGFQLYVRGKRLAAYEAFRRATLVAIFLMQFFLFLRDELSALFSFGVFISVYVLLSFAIQAERRYVSEKK